MPHNKSNKLYMEAAMTFDTVRQVSPLAGWRAQRKGLVANPLCGFAYWKSRSVFEELERKARPRLVGMRPKTKYQSKHQLPTAYAKRSFQN
jgi:hypothetical protein